MFGWGARNKSQAKKTREAERDHKILSGQTALLSAASDTSIVAQEVTAILKEKLADSNKKFDVATGILHDALIICDPNGTILFANRAARRIFNKFPDANFKNILCPQTRHLDLWELLAASRIIHGLCDANAGLCQDLDLKTEKLVWADGSFSIFIAIRDPFHKPEYPDYAAGCRYPDIN